MTAWLLSLSTPPYEQVLQVFVQQKLTTSYETSTCTFNDICE